MFDLSIQKDIKEHFNTTINSTSLIKSGELIQVYSVTLKSGQKLLLKLGIGKQSKAILKAEIDGLKLLATANSLQTPKVLLSKFIKEDAYIIFEFIEKATSADYMRLFGKQLAKMHSLSLNESFGYTKDNFIGLLPQSNQPNKKWSEFYWMQRIEPQYRLAFDKGFTLSKISENLAEQVFYDTFSPHTPCVVHGDLWNGNYIDSNKGVYLIDPSAYYGHPIMDIGMSKLFGGFSVAFYEGYYEILPKPNNEKEQSELAQLYYLLVHLNLFGSSYFNQVKDIIDKYFA